MNITFIVKLELIVDKTGFGDTLHPDLEFIEVNRKLSVVDELNLKTKILMTQNKET